MQKEVKHSWFYEEAAEIIWDYLTQPDLIAKWLMANDFKPAIGHEFYFKTNPVPSLNLDGKFYCRVLELEPLKKLSYSWKGGPGNGDITLDTLVTWSLEPKDAGTMLHLVHSGFTDDNAAIYAGMLNGWQQNIQKMLGLIKTKPDANTGA